MSQLLKSGYKFVIRSLLGALLLGTLLLISFYTPVFSSVGLWVLNHLPVPYIEHTEPASNSLSTSDPDNHASQSYPAPNNLNLDLPLQHQPTAYVVLGGGLTESDTYHDTPPVDTALSSEDKVANEASNQADNQDSKKESTVSNPSESDAENQTNRAQNHKAPMSNIVLNDYTRMRMQTVMWYYKQYPLPIVLTGVDAPWMQDWLFNYGIDNIITENASMNTCENARFTAKRLKLSDVYLITDAYHMTRARRQFALNGIHTTPIAAALPMKKGWLVPKKNAQHSRRTLYELAAYARDVFAPQKNCRSANEVSFDTLKRSRKPEDVKTF